MTSYRLYTGAPRYKELGAASEGDKWAFVPSHIASAAPDLKEGSSVGGESGHGSFWIIPAATLNEASERISGMYRNVIFDDEGADEEDEEEWVEQEIEGFLASPADGINTRNSSNDGSLISWPPTNPTQSRTRKLSSPSISLSRIPTDVEVHADHSVSVSYAYTSLSSIALFPAFVINLHTLSTLSTLNSQLTSLSTYRKVNILVAVLEADGPELVTIKKGKDAGKEVSVLKLIVSDETGVACKITAWREVAERWAGHITPDNEENMVDIDTSVDAVKRGDIVYLTNISVSAAPNVTDKESTKRPNLSFSASPYLNSNMNICYRTMPSVTADKQYRPDLRLAASDPGLRRVADVVRWFQDAVGLAGE